MGLANDLSLSCAETNRAGIARIFFISACNITSFTADTTAHSFNAVTTDSTADVWYQYEFEPESKSFNKEGANENGTPSFTNTLSGMVKGLDKTKLKRFQDLIDERKLVAIFESTNKSGTNKIAYVLGWDDILEIDAAAKPNVQGVIEGEFDGDNSLTLELAAKHAELLRVYRGSIETNSDGTVNFAN